MAMSRRSGKPAWKIQADKTRASRILSRKIRENERIIRQLERTIQGERDGDKLNLISPIIAPEGEDRAPDLSPEEMEQRKEKLVRLGEKLREEKSLLESFVLPDVKPSLFDNMATGEEFPPTEQIVELLKQAQTAIIGEGEIPEITDAVKAFSKNFDKEEAIQNLLDVRRHIQAEELAASEENRPMKLNLAKLEAFRKVLAVDEFLNSGLRSKDKDVKAWASYMKDELFRQANERSMAERMETLRKLEPEKLKKLVTNRTKAGADWLQDSGRQFGQLLGKPDNLFGIYILASLLPIPGLLVLAGAVLPLGISLTDMAIAKIAGERAIAVQNDKEGLAKLMLSDSASSAVLRAMGTVADKTGLSLGDILNGYGVALSDPDSVYNKVKKTIESSKLGDKDLLTRITGHLEPIYRYSKSEGLDFYSFGIEKDKQTGEYRTTARNPEQETFARETFARLNDSIFRSELKDFLISGDEKGLTRAGAYAALRPVEAILFIKALREGYYDDHKLKVSDSLMNRCFPCLLDITEENRNIVIQGILEQYGDGTRELSGRYVARTKEELAVAPMEYLIAGAAKGRGNFNDALFERFKTGDIERLTTELMALSDRIVHPHVKNIEEIVNVNSAALSVGGLESSPVTERFNPMIMYDNGSDLSPLNVESPAGSFRETTETKTEIKTETKEVKETKQTPQKTGAPFER